MERKTGIFLRQTDVRTRRGDVNGSTRVTVVIQDEDEITQETSTAEGEEDVRMSCRNCDDVGSKDTMILATRFVDFDEHSRSRSFWPLLEYISKGIDGLD